MNGPSLLFILLTSSFRLPYMPDPRVVRLAQVLVDYSINVQPGQRVAITGLTPVAPLVEAVFERVLEQGGHPQLLLGLPGLEALFFRRASDAQLAFVSPFFHMVAGEFEGHISLGGASNTRQLNGVDPARQVIQRKALAPALETYMRRAAEGKLNWVVAQYPTDANAQDAEMSLRDYEDFVYGACHVDDPALDSVAHWRRVSAEQQRLADWMKPHDQIAIRGPNVDLTLSVKDRIFINADGRRNMPDGEIFTGPVEDSANGWVRFTYPVVAFGREIDGIELKFEHGRAVQASARKNEEFLLSALDTDAGSRYVGEFAIGTNFGITRFTKSILFDEKLGGSFHMALGAGYPDTGSRNKSGLHWDMICDMREGEIRVDGELFYQGGAFKV
jgi:aminopeptidase